MPQWGKSQLWYERIISSENLTSVLDLKGRSRNFLERGERIFWTKEHSYANVQRIERYSTPKEKDRVRT